MEKLKEFWNKLKYWHKSAFIGALFGIFIQLLVYFIRKFHFDFGVFFDFAFIHFIPVMIFDFGDIFNNIIILFWYIFLGIILGQLFKVLNHKFSKNMAILFFSLIILLLIIVFYFIEYQTLSIIFGGFA